jgi:hypothetical protein
MTTWQAGGHVQDLAEWPAIDRFCALVLDTAAGLEHRLKPNDQWLAFRLEEIARLMPEVLEASWHRPFLHEFVLGVHQAHTFLTVLDYYVSFMERQGYLPADRAGAVSSASADLRAELSTLLTRMRRVLLSQPERGRLN